MAIFSTVWKKFKAPFMAVQAVLQPRLAPPSHSPHSTHSGFECMLLLPTTGPLHWMFPLPRTLLPPLILQIPVQTSLPQINLPSPPFPQVYFMFSGQQLIICAFGVCLLPGTSSISPLV